jgi:hypothetical protein
LPTRPPLHCVQHLFSTDFKLLRNLKSTPLIARPFTISPCRPKD